MGNNGGTPLEKVGVDCLKRINPDVLHFVEDGVPCDEGNIPITAHLKRLSPWTYRICTRLGCIGQRFLFKLHARKWKKYNDAFFTLVSAELEKRKIDSISLVYCNSALLVECGKKLSLTFRCPIVPYFYGTFLGPCIGNRDAYLAHATEYLGWTTPVDLRICLDDGTKGFDVARDLGLPLEKFLFQPHGLAVDKLDKEIDSLLTKDLFSENMYYVMTASRLSSWKRIDRLLRAVPHVVQGIRNVRFLILGDGQERQKLENLSEELNISEWIRFVGPVPQETVFGFMRKCDVFVSTNDFSNLSEGMKQAMYLGMCVVATDTGDTHTLIKDNITGKLVPSDDELALANTLKQVLSESETRHQLGISAKALIDANEPTEEAVICERIEVLSALIKNYSKP
jgi:glycosyltransferase involved in cell wall biosynthesis